MTSLFNRSTFFALGEKALREHAGFMALCIIDLDKFKQINDELGHQVGDQAIRMTANAILESLQVDVSDAWEYKRSVLKEGGSFAGRLGGDEFVVLVRDKASMDEVCVQMQGLLDRLNSLDEGEIHGLYASVGVTEIVQGELDVDSAYKRSDAALYGAKRSGKNQIGRG
jgi:GGDEF domain-containing protein